MTSVTYTRPEYDEQLKDVQQNRDAVKGERAVKSKDIQYLPPLPSMYIQRYYSDNGDMQITHGRTLTSEGQASYYKYLSLAYFYGASGRTVDGLSGLIFSKPAVSEFDPQVEYLETNVDGKGNSIRKQSKMATEEAFISPRSGLLVDFPKVEERMSLTEMEAQNLRPKILHYPFESIINWFYDVVDNELRLSLVVLKEEIEVLSDDGFEVKKETQYRVLRLIDGVYHQEIYDESGELASSVLVMVNDNTSREIPFYFIEVGAEGTSVINDLVDANMHHYRTYADYGAKNHASAFPVFTETGVVDDDTNVSIGPGVKWSSGSVDAQFGILQADGNSDSLRLSLQDMEQRMSALGAEMLKPRISGAESAEAKSLDQVAQNSTTGDVAISVSEAYTKAINFASTWLDGPGESQYMLNTDYNPTGLSGQDLTALVNAYLNATISPQTLYENLQRGEIANPQRTFEEEQALIAAHGQGLGGNPVE